MNSSYEFLRSKWSNSQSTLARYSGFFGFAESFPNFLETSEITKIEIYYAVFQTIQEFAASQEDFSQNLCGNLKTIKFTLNKL